MKRKDILKRLSLLFVAVVLTVFGASCTGEEPRKSSVVSPDEAIESKVGKDSEETPQDEINEDENNEAIPTATPTAAPEYQEGKIEEKSFESEYIGVKFNLPDGYKMYNREQVNAIMAELIQDDTTVGDMSYETIIHSEKGDVQVVIAVDHNKGQYSEEEYLGGIANGYRQIPTAQISGEISYAHIAGMEFSAIEISSGDTSMLHCVKKKNTDMLYYVITYPKGNIDAVQTVMNAFVPM